MHRDNTDRKDRKLQSQRHALRDVLGEVAFRDGEVLPVKPQLGISGKGVEEACHGADELRENRCNRRARDAPAERQNEQKVQPDIQNRGEQQKHQRRDRITHRAQERADEVIKKLRADTGKDNGAVCKSRRIDSTAVQGDVDPREHRI